MTDPIPFLKDLLSAPGLSGYEDPVAKIIEDKWRPLVNEISRGKLGSLHGLRHGSAEPPRPSVMVATHMDAIGLMVTGITEGFLHISEVGGVDARILPGTPVNVFSTGAGQPGYYPALVALPSAPLLPEQEREGPVALEHLLVDTGLLPPQVTQLVRVGDLVSFAQPPVELSGETLSGHSLDNRASVAALTVCLEELQGHSHPWDVWAVATSQEEVGLIGAGGSAFELHPSMVIVVDVTFAKAPGTFQLAHLSNWQRSDRRHGAEYAPGFA